MIVWQGRRPGTGGFAVLCIAAFIEGFTKLQNWQFLNKGHNTPTRKEKNFVILRANSLHLA